MDPPQAVSVSKSIKGQKYTVQAVKPQFKACLVEFARLRKWCRRGKRMGEEGADLVQPLLKEGEDAM